MITQQLMRPGNFTVNLVEDTPFRVASAVDVFDHIVITVNRLQPIEAFSDANILANAIYTGVVTKKPTPISFSGHDLSYWLETPNGLGDLLDTAISGNAATLSTWVTALRPASVGAGTVTNTGNSHTATYQYLGRREVLDAVCRAVVAEWRVNPNCTLDAGPVANLFVTVPTIVVTRKEEGQEGLYRGLDGQMIQVAKDVEQHTTKVMVAGSGAGVTMTFAEVIGSSAYFDFFGNTVVMERLIDAPEADPLAAAQLAAAAQVQFLGVRRELTLSSRTYAVTRFVDPGDYVYVYDQFAELNGGDDQIVYRGQVIDPIKLRVYALTWPLERGVGVYARSGVTQTYTDLTDHVRWEDGSDVTWEVGGAPYPMSEWGTA